MALHFLKADVIFPVTSPPIQQGVLVVDDRGIIHEVIDPVLQKEKHYEILSRADLNTISGALVPGFINSHCHLELSHLKGKIPLGTGLPEFLRAVTKIRQADHVEIQQAMTDAVDEMKSEGIVAVGDISNGADSLQIKTANDFKWHTFIEVFDLHPDFAEARFKNAIALENDFINKGQSVSIVPHANYTVSSRLASLISKHSMQSSGILSIHNQETPSEDLFFLEGNGQLADFLYATGKYDYFKPSGKSAIHAFLSSIAEMQQILLVHNTFTAAEDVRFALQHFRKLYWCLCPKANLYIENAAPPLKLLLDSDGKVVIGTDSLSSNDRLSILDELKLLSHQNTEMTFSELLNLATIVPAQFFGWEDVLGSFEKGKAPGVLQLSDNSAGLFNKANTLKVVKRHF